DLVGRGAGRDREVPQPGQQLLPDVGGPVGEPPRAVRVPVEIPDRRRPVLHVHPPSSVRPGDPGDGPGSPTAPPPAGRTPPSWNGGRSPSRTPRACPPLD